MPKKKLTPNAFSRLFTLTSMELTAARNILADDSYSDFFVEGSGPPWHEAFTDIIYGHVFDHSDAVKKLATGKSRMEYVKKILASSKGDDYNDFFVEGSGPPWHEAVTSDKFSRVSSVDERAHILRKSNVLKAYNRLRSGF